MTLRTLAVVESWLDAVNHVDEPRLLDLSADDVAIVGPRGVGRGRELLSQWLARAGFTAQAVRWFCGAGGFVVVEQDAHWVMPGTGATGRARVASAFTVRDSVVARFERFDDLERALQSAGMSMRDEVTTRSG
jgi:hypothetical protein